MFKKEKGITLIALIVTIIVLLILAAVTINIAVQNNGIFVKSKQATNAWLNSENTEKTALNAAETEMNSIMATYGIK